MRRTPTLDEIVAANPHLDKKELKKALDALKKSEERLPNISKSGSGVPYGRRRIVVGKGFGSDPRTVYVGKRTK
jgi:hypothetical protein